MVKRLSKLDDLIILSIVCVLVGGGLFPVVLASNVNTIKGFDKGPSFNSVVPLKKVTFIGFDEDSYLDDYAYLAAVPTAVFNDGDKLFSHPLLFYQDEYPVEEDKERSLDARQGLDYFMEDWMSYCNGYMDQLTLINVPKNKLDSSWKAKKYVHIEGNNPFRIASELALHDWSYSDDAVIAVIDEKFEKLEDEISGKLTDTLIVDKEIKTEHFEVEQTNRLNPVYNEFNVPEGYIYLDARCWYPSITKNLGLPLLGFDSFANITIPSGDKDLQLYCLYDGDWMQVFTLDEWNQKTGMDKEKSGTYIYKNGRWKAGVTDVPTKGLRDFWRYGSWIDVLKSLRKVVYQVDIRMYLGERIHLFEDVPFDCRDITIELSCDNADLGFCLIGPSGEQILCDENGVIEVGELGECLPGESYDLVIYSKDDVKGSYDYEISYSYHKRKTRYESDCLTSATEGAVLASVINAPLLYTSTSSLSGSTRDVLYKLGVENIYLVDLGSHISKDAEKEIDDIAKIKESYIEPREVYDAIRKRTGSNDVVFSTVDSWRPWFVYEMKPTDEIEMPNALHVGPAAYIAAHHGTPVIIVDNHPELSSAVVYHNEYWERTATYPEPPTVAEMYLTGKRVWNFLKDLGFDEIGEETLITVAGQFNIGATWDRVFIGVANSGRFIGSPVDTAYWISRNMFYPVLVFVNPASNPDGVSMIQGSHSKRRQIFPWGPRGLKITQPSYEETVEYPVQCTFIHYEHRFNERASKYWGFTYQCADGLTPGEDYTMNPIDQGVSKTYIGEEGSLFPDMSMSDVIPAYLEKGGYGSAFSVSLPAVMNNVNNGVLLWIHCAHGGHINGGCTQYWTSKREPNPWRMYELYQGSTEEPDTISLEIHGILPALMGNPSRNGLFRTAFDWAPAKMPIRDKISKLLSIIPIVNKILPEAWLDTQDYYDGMVNTALLSQLGTKYYGGIDLDDQLGNLHSTGFIANSCLIATKYMQLAIIRHGSTFQIADPWGTSWYSAVWMQSVPRDIILGDTVGKAFTKGISHVGILHLTDPPQWWWDNHETVIYYGDPDLRLFVPGTEYSDANYWEKKDTKSLRYDEELLINGHMPFGATAYPHAKEPAPAIPLWIIAIIMIVLVIIVVAVAVTRKKTQKK